MGATVDAFSVEWSVEQYYPDLAQARGPVAGTGRVVKGEFRVKVKLVEWQYATLSLICGSYGTSSDANSEQLGGGTLGIAAEVTNVVITGVTRNDGRVCMVTVPSAYTEIDNFELNEARETIFGVTFHGLFTASTPRTLPGYMSFAIS